MKTVFGMLAAMFLTTAFAQVPIGATVTRIAQNDVLLKQAEVSLTLSNGKTVVGYLNGLNELQGSGTTLTAVPLAVPVANCYFAGLVEHQGHLYASCTTNWGLLNAKAVLLGAAITPDLAQMRFTVLAQPAGVYGSNGLAFDGKGSFYLADSGVTSGKILQIKLSAPLKAEAPRTVHTSLKRPNGIRYDATANAIYFTENPYLVSSTGVVGTANLNKASLGADGGFTGVKKVYSVNGYLDGFTLTKSGVMLPDPITRKLYHFDESTLATSTLVTDIGATSVSFKCSTCRELVVTDAFRNAVFQVTPYSPYAAR